MACKILPHKEAINNTKQLLVDVGALKSMQSNQIADLALFQQWTAQLEKDAIKWYGVSGRPWLQETNGNFAYPNGRVLKRIDDVRKAKNLYEGRLPANYKPPQQVVQQPQIPQPISVVQAEQIHILASKQDIEGFKGFVKNNNKELFNNRQRDEEEITFDGDLRLNDSLYDTNFNGLRFESEKVIEETNDILLDDSKDFVKTIDIEKTFNNNVRDTTIVLIIKPLAFELGKESLIKEFINENADILEEDEIFVDSYKISQHYSQFKNEPFFSDLVEYYTGKKAKVYKLKVSADSIDNLRKQLGHSSNFINDKTSLRYKLVGEKFYNIKSKFGVIDNGIHLSDSAGEGLRESNIWFGIPKIYTNNLNAVKAHKYLYTQLRSIDKSVSFSGGTLDGTEITSKPTDLDYRIMSDDIDNTLEEIKNKIPGIKFDKEGIDPSSGSRYIKLEYDYEGGKADIAIVPFEGYLGRVSGNHLAALMSDTWKIRTATEKEKYYNLYLSAKNRYGKESKEAKDAKEKYEEIKEKFRKQVYEWFRTSKIIRDINEQYAVSEIGNKEFNSFLDDISETFDNKLLKVVKAPLKSLESLKLKADLKYNGRVYKAQDIVRATLVITDLYNKDILDYVFTTLKSKFAQFTVENYFKYPKLGYKGINISILSNDDGVIELQINTPVMIYLKEVKETALNILGEDLYNKLDKKYNGIGGKGHLIYDRIKKAKLDNNINLVKELEQKSIDYYSNKIDFIEPSQEPEPVLVDQTRDTAPTYYQLSPNEVNYQLKTVSIVTNNIQQINKLFSRLGNTDQFWNKIQRDFQIPKDQLELLRQENGSTIEEKLDLTNFIIDESKNKPRGIDTSPLSDSENVLWGTFTINESGTSRVFSPSVEKIPVGYNNTLHTRTDRRTFEELWNSKEFSYLEREQILFSSLIERLKSDSFNGKLFKYIENKFGKLDSNEPRNNERIRFIDQSDMPPLFVNQGVVYVNRSFYTYIHSLDIPNIDEYIEVSLSEELIHIVTDSVMTDTDYLSVLSEIPISIRQQIQILYPSVNFEDPYNSLILVDEYLRMLIQDVIFGKTTKLVKNQSSTGLSILQKVWNFIKDFIINNYPKIKSTNIVLTKSLNFINESQVSGTKMSQLESKVITQTSLTPEVKERLMEFAKKAGIKVESLEDLLSKRGVNGLADIKNMLIQLQQGKEDFALAEEVAHFFVEGLDPESELYQEMLRIAPYTRLYQQVAVEYSKAYGDNKEMLKKETMGKLISLYLTDKKMFEYWAAPRNTSIWDKIVNWIKKFLGYTNKKKSYASFIEAAEEILDLKTEQLYWDPRSEVMMFSLGGITPEFITLGGKDLTDKQVLVNLNDTLFLYSAYRVPEDDPANSKKKEMARGDGNTNLDDYYQNAQLTSLAKEFQDKIEAKLINPENIVVYTSMPVRDSLRTRVQQLFPGAKVVTSMQVKTIQTEDGPVLEFKSTQEFLEEYPDSVIIDDKNLNKTRQIIYNIGIKYERVKKVIQDNIKKEQARKEQSDLVEEFKQLGPLFLADQIQQAHFQLFSKSGLLKSTEYLEKALGKITPEEVNNLFKDKRGSIVLPVQAASKAKRLIQIAEKESEAILSFVATMEGMTSFYETILQNAKKIDASTATEQQIEALIYEMNKVSHISSYWLDFAETLLEELRTKEKVTQATALVSKMKNSIEQAQKEVLNKSRGVVATKLSGVISDYNYGMQARISDINQMVSTRKTAKGKNLSDKDIEILLKEKRKIENEKMISPEKIINVLTGKEKDIAPITTWIKSLPNTGDPLIASVGKLIRTLDQEVHIDTLNETQVFAQENVDLMKKYGITQKDIEDNLLVEELYRYYDAETQEFKTEPRVAFLNRFKDRHIFFEEMAKVNEAKKAWNESKREREDPELKEAYLKAKVKFEKFKLQHWNQEFTPEYYTRYDELKAEFGELVFEDAMIRVSSIYDDIKQLEQDIIDEIVEDEEDAYKSIQDLRRSLALMKLTHNENGTPKPEADRKIAELLQRKSEIDRDIFTYEVDHKKFQDAVMELVNSHDVDSKVKEEISLELEKKNYTRVVALASPIDPRIEKWFEINTITKPSQAFYDARNEITDQLSKLFEEVNTMVGSPPKETLNELWNKIFVNVRPYRDEDGNIEPTAIPPYIQSVVQQFNQQLEDIKQQTSQLKEDAKFTPEKKKRFEELNKEIQGLIKKLKDIQSKDIVEEYYSEFEKHFNKSPISQKIPNIEIDQILSLYYDEVTDFIEQNPTDEFSLWFARNHYSTIKYTYDEFSGESYPSDEYTPTYIWTKVKPNDETQYEAIPSIKFGTRKVVDTYVTKPIPYVNWNPVTQRWLPKSERFMNPAFLELQARAKVAGSKEEGLFDLLNRLTEFHMETQQDSIGKAKLEWFIPSVQQRDLEGNIITGIYKKFTDRGNVFEEGEGNFEDNQPEKLNAKERLFKLWNHIDSYVSGGAWQAPESVEFDERTGQYVEKRKKIPVAYSGYMKPGDVSKDVTLTTLLFRQSVNKANAVRNAVPTINLLEKLLENSPNQKNRMEALKFMQDNKFYGINKQYEVGKALDRSLRYMRKVYRVGSLSDFFGFFNTIKNSLQGRLQNFINSEFAGWSDPKSMRKAAKYYKNNLWFFLAESEKPLEQRDKDWFIQAYMNPGNFDKLLLFTQPGAMKKFGSENFAFLSTATFEYAISINALYSHLFHKQLQRELPDGSVEVKSLYDVITIKDKQPFIEEGWTDEYNRPIDSSYFIKMKTQMLSILEYTQGKMSDMTKLQTTTIGQALLFFKGWLVPMLRRRFDKKRANYILDKEIEGYWTAFFRMSWNMIRNFKEYQETNWNTFTDEEKANYHTALREMVTMLVSSLLVSIGFGFDVDDKEKFKKVKELDFFTQTALLIAVQTKLETESLSPVPFVKLEGGMVPPLLSEAPKHFTNPVIGMTLITDVFKMLDNTAKLVSGDESAYYSQNMPQYNIEKGDTKAAHFFKRLVQLDDLDYTWTNPEGRLEVLIGIAKR